MRPELVASIKFFGRYRPYSGCQTSGNESSDGTVKLGALQGRLTLLEVACARCTRRGRLRLDKLRAAFQSVRSSTCGRIGRRLYRF